MTTQQMKEVMQAYADGKAIEYSVNNKNWKSAPSPDWDWNTYNYRIKPESKETYRPYKNFDEFRAEWEKHGGWVYDKRNHDYILYKVFNTTVPSYILEFKLWADDGTPCGIKIN